MSTTAPTTDGLSILNNWPNDDTVLPHKDNTFGKISMARLRAPDPELSTKAGISMRPGSEVNPQYVAYNLFGNLSLINSQEIGILLLCLQLILGRFRKLRNRDYPSRTSAVNVLQQRTHTITIPTRTSRVVSWAHRSTLRVVPDHPESIW
jgi:hypothetical protein